MSQLLRTEAVEIGNKTFQIRVLPFGESRKVEGVIKRAMGAFDPELGDSAGLLLAGVAGQISDADMDRLVQVFGKATTVDFQDGNDERPSRVLILSDDKNLGEVFCGQLEDMYTWLDACVQLNFKGLIAKMKGAIIAVAAKAEDKAKAKSKAE